MDCALWHMGWNIWNLMISDNMGGVNLIAHISGGLSGYLIGYFFLKECRDETRDA